MFSRYTAALLGTASAIALAHTSVSVAQQTSQPQASNGATLEEVVVTARRREEKAQTVPITITTFTQAQLADQNIRTANDLNKALTAVQLCCNRGAVSFTWIRGIQGVDGYLNGLALSTLTASGLQSGLSGSSLYFDLANVQVLKGPQGTLFGESTDAGAILFETQRPVNDFEGYAEAEVGNYGHVLLDGVLNAPIVSDKLLVRVGGEYVKTDGFVHDFSTNKDFYDENYWIGRVQATFRPTDDFENNIFVNYYNFHGNGTAFVWTLVNPTGRLEGL
ncbi:MAG TPA: TonB-dependent receptor plug domain-containing protein [Alphaproteobacteria bacterium]|nr:TonB-dependent receptor plug domain-containing protein [Alphaproteobacteria bacterium]